MKNIYGKSLSTFVLAFALASSTFAGEIQHPVAPPPPPSPNGVTETGGVIHTGVAESTPDAADALTETALNLLRSVLALF